MADDSPRPLTERRQLPRAVPAALRHWEEEREDLESRVEYWRSRARRAEFERDNLLERLRDSAAS